MSSNLKEKRNSNKQFSLAQGEGNPLGNSDNCLIISDETLERVRETPIYDIVSCYLTLEAIGPNYKALSPFTNEKTPSFFVVPSKNIFKCFSSSLGGDGIRFVKEFLKTDFRSAVIEICNKVNIPILHNEKTSSVRPTKNDPSYALNQLVADYYHKNLLSLLKDCSHPVAHHVLQKRQFSLDSIIQWQLGYSPNHKNEYGFETLEFMLKEHNAMALARDLGLITERGGRLTERFRGRLIFPIFEQYGRISGFAGRFINEQAERQLKYVNSTGSGVYKKASILYGLNFALSSISKEKWVSLVEGYTDVISLHQNGISNAVGMCGTALSDEQCRSIRRHCNRVVILPDSDKAGEQSASRNIDKLLQHGLQVEVVPMPNVNGGEKMDPDDLARRYASDKVDVASMTIISDGQ